MTIVDNMGTPVADPVDPFPVTVDPCRTPIASQPAEPPDPKGNRLMRSASIAVAVLGIGIAVAAFAVSRTGDPNAAPSPAAPQAIPAHIAGFAELFVATHLSGATAHDDMVALYPDAVPPSAAGGIWVTRANTTAGFAIEQDVWLLTVAAEVLELVDGAYRPAGIQYFSVSVAQGAQQPVALAAPGRVPAPVGASPLAAATRFTAALPLDQEQTAAAFLRAHLTGEGDVARYVAPTGRITPFAAAPYTSLEIHSTKADSLGNVRAVLTAITANGASHVLEYTLAMRYEAGSWEVVELAPATTER